MDFHIFGCETTDAKTEKSNEIGEMQVTRALNDTEKIRKGGVDIFANVGLEKP